MTDSMTPTRPSDPAVNEAAERLRANLGHIPLQAERGLARLDLVAALASERRNAVERIRARGEAEITAHGCKDPDMDVPCSFHATLRDILAELAS